MLAINACPAFAQTAEDATASGENSGETASYETAGETAEDIPEAGGEGGSEADEELIEEGGLLYRISNGSLTLVAVTDESIESVSVPSFVNGMAVERIASTAFENCICLESVEIPESVKYIDSSVFNSCNALRSITVPFIGTSIDLPEKIDCFFGYDYSRIPNTLQVVKVTSPQAELADSAFMGMPQLKIAEINCRFIGVNAFSGCTGLLSAKLGDGVEDIGNDAFFDCKKLTKLTLGENVEIISGRAFAQCSNLSSVKIPDKVDNISNDLFQNCKNLKTVVLPDGIEKIERGAFFECSSLESIDMPENLGVIYEDAFSECTNLKSVSFNHNLSEIMDNAFSGCTALKEVKLPEKLMYIGQGAFRRTGITSIVIPDSIRQINNDTFNECTSLESIILSENIGGIGSFAFFNCKNLERITLPLMLRNIENNAFENCTSLGSIVFPQWVSSVGTRAFANCTSLTSVTIPDSVTYFSTDAFDMCENLAYINYGGDEFEWENLFGGSITPWMNNAKITFNTVTKEDNTEFEYLQSSCCEEEFHSFDRFGEKANPVWLVPALKQGFIPDSAGVYSRTGKIMIAGHFEDSKPSAILMLDQRSGEYDGEYSLEKDGEYVTDKITGIASYGDYVYITLNNKIGRIPVSEFSSSKASVSCDVYYPTPFSDGNYEGELYMGIGNNILYVGNTYIPGKDSSKAGVFGKTAVDSMICAYELNRLNGSFLTETPLAVYNIAEENVKGVARYFDSFVISTSTDISEASSFKRINMDVPGGRSIKIGETSVPYYEITEDGLMGELTAPPLAGGVFVSDEELMAVFSSSPVKYADYDNSCTDEIWSLCVDYFNNNEGDDNYIPEGLVSLSASLFTDEIKSVIDESYSGSVEKLLLRFPNIGKTVITNGSTTRDLYSYCLGDYKIKKVYKDNESGVLAVAFENPLKGVFLAYATYSEELTYSDFLRGKEFVSSVFDDIVESDWAMFVTATEPASSYAAYAALKNYGYSIIFGNVLENVYRDAIMELGASEEGNFYGINRIELDYIGEDNIKYGTNVHYSENEESEASGALKYLFFDDGEFWMEERHREQRGNNAAIIGDTIFGTDYDDTVISAPGINAVYTGSGNDGYFGSHGRRNDAVITGGNQEKVIIGGTGDNDYYVQNGYDLSVTIVDAGGKDTIHLSSDLDERKLWLEGNWGYYQDDEIWITFNANRVEPFVVTDGTKSISIGAENKNKNEVSAEELYSIVLPKNSIATVYNEKDEIISQYNYINVKNEYDKYGWYTDDYCVASAIEKDGDGMLCLNFVNNIYKVVIEKESPLKKYGEPIELRAGEITRTDSLEALFKFVPEKSGGYYVESRSSQTEIVIYDEGGNEIAKNSNSCYSVYEKGKTYYIYALSHYTGLKLVLNEGTAYGSPLYEKELTEGENKIELPRYEQAKYSFTPLETGIYRAYTDDAANLYISGSSNYVKLIKGVTYPVEMTSYGYLSSCVIEKIPQMEYDENGVLTASSENEKTISFSLSKDAPLWYLALSDNDDGNQPFRIFDVKTNREYSVYSSRQRLSLPAGKDYILEFLSDNTTQIIPLKLSEAECDEATEIELGETALSSDDEIIYSFVPEESGYYGFETEYGILCSDVYDEGGEMIYNSYCDLLLAEGRKYYIIVANTAAEENATLTLQREANVSGTETVFVPGNGQSTIFFIPSETGYYDVNFNDDNKYSYSAQSIIENTSPEWENKYMVFKKNLPYEVSVYNNSKTDGNAAVSINYVPAGEKVVLTENESIVIDGGATLYFTPKESGYYTLVKNESESVKYGITDSAGRWVQGYSNTSYYLCKDVEYKIEIYANDNSATAGYSLNTPSGAKVGGASGGGGGTSGSTSSVPYNVTMKAGIIELDDNLPEAFVGVNTFEGDEWGEVNCRFVPDETGFYTFRTEGENGWINVEDSIGHLSGNISHEGDSVKYSAYLAKGQSYTIFASADGKNQTVKEVTIEITKKANGFAITVFDAEETKTATVSLEEKEYIVIDENKEVSLVSGEETSEITMSDASYESIEISDEPLSINIGEMKTVSAQTSDGEVCKNIVWSTDNPEAVKLIPNTDGSVSLYAVKSGSAVLTATLADNKNISSSINITVGAEDAPLYTVEGEQKNGIYTGEVTVTAQLPEGYDAVYINGEERASVKFGYDGKHKATIYAKNTLTGEYTSSVEIIINIDTSAPVIMGVSDGAVYYLEKFVTVSDKEIASVIVNGSACEKYTDIEFKEGKHTLTAVDKLGNSTTVSFEIKGLVPETEITEQIYSKVLFEFNNVSSKMSEVRRLTVQGILDLYKSSLEKKNPWYMSEIYYSLGKCYISVINFADDYSLLPLLTMTSYDKNGRVIEENTEYVYGEFANLVISEQLLNTAKIVVTLKDEEGNELCAEKEITFEEKAEGTIVRMVVNDCVYKICSVDEFLRTIPQVSGEIFEGWYLDEDYSRASRIDTSDFEADSNFTVYSRMVPENEPIKTKISTDYKEGEAKVILTHDYVVLDGIIVIAVFDENGKMLVCAKGEVEKGDMITEIPFEFMADEDRDYDMKVMYWKSLTSMIPFATAIDEKFVTKSVIEINEVLESSHNYPNNCDESKTYTYPGNCESITLIFSSDTIVENNYDKIYIYDGVGELYNEYTGTSLAGAVITVPGNSVTVRLTSDGSVQYYGYRTEKIIVNR